MQADIVSMAFQKREIVSNMWFWTKLILAGPTEWSGWFCSCLSIQSIIKTPLVDVSWKDKMSQLMKLWYLSHRRPAKAQASLRICAVSPEPSLFAHIKYGSKRMVRRKIRHLASVDDCACTFEKWVYGGRKEPLSHDMAQTNLLLCSTYKPALIPRIISY